MLGRHVRLVVPRGAGAWLRRRGFQHVTELAAGDTLSDGDLRITGVRAEHSGHRWGPRSTHGPDTDALGHLIEGGGSCVYVSGDTALHDSMPLLGERAVDVALLPVWGWGPTLGPGHLDPIEAAEAVSLIRPKVAVPVHWGTLTLAGIGPRSPLGGRMRRLLVEPPRRFAAEVARRALATTVLVTEPGAPVALPSPAAGAA
jgi:L-ascorbate metabolism protein UlaG (beta-lactamase superfamily)